MFAFSNFENTTKNVAELITRYFSKFLEDIARAGILEEKPIISAVVIVIKLGRKYPELHIQMIDTLSDIYAILTKQAGLLSEDKRLFILQVIEQRIDQLKQFVKNEKVKARKQKSVNLAKKKVELLSFSY